MQHLHLMVYDEEHLEEQEDLPLAEAIDIALRPGVGWITLWGPDEADYALLEERLGLHPLALEDSRNQRQRPKVEEYPGNTYVVARSLTRDPESGEVLSFQSNIFFSANWVLVIHERPLGLFTEVRERIRRGRMRIRSSGPDYLVYSLVDAVVDTYFPLLEDIGTRLEALEDVMYLGEIDDESLDRIHQLKSDLRRARRTVYPARDMMMHLNREEARGFQEKTLPFLRDVQDHIGQAIDLVENHREATGSLMDLYLNLVSNRMNEVMKVLTIVATLFIPLSFLAGVYGMNFDTSEPGNMPELGLPYAYLGFWGFVVVIFVGAVWLFKRKGWI